MEAYSKEAFPPRGFVSPTGDTRHLGRVRGGSFGTCNMFWFLEAEDVTGDLTAEISTQQARGRQEKLAHPLRPAQQLRALIKIIA